MRGHPPWEITKAVLHKLAEWGVREVLYLGGEPMLHPRFDDVIELGSRLGLSQRVVTNGSRINGHRTRLLARHDVEVGVSLHSANASVHNRLTGSRHGHQRAIKALSLLIESRVRTFVQYSPTRLDAKGLEFLADLLCRYCGERVRFIDVNRLLPFGEALQDKGQAVLDADGLWNVLKIVGELVSSCGWIVRVESVPHCWIRDRATIDGLQSGIISALLASLRPCYMGIIQLALDPIGRVKMCPGGSPVFASILNIDLQEFWHHNCLMHRLRDLSFLPERCINFITGYACQYLYECKGGCSSAGHHLGSVDPLIRLTGLPVVHHSSSNLLSSRPRNS